MNYRFYHPARKPPLLGIVLGFILYGLGVFGLLFFAVFGLWFLLHDHDWELFWLLLISALVSGFMMILGKGGLAAWRHRKMIGNCFIAFMDTAFVYQDYDYIQGKIVRKVIPLSALRRFEYVQISSGSPDTPDTHEVHVHYVDAEGQPQTLVLGYFDYETPDSPSDTLTREWQYLLRNHSTS